MKESKCEKYLGDQIHCEGLAKSSEATVDKRYWITMSAILEISTIVQDFRVHVVGGLNTGLNLWEMAVIPMLLTNADTWHDISDNTVDKIDDLQNMLIRNLLQTPRSTPKPALS